MNKIIHDDCLNYLRSLPDKAFPLILTDPPYGLGIAKRGVIGTGKRFTPKSWDVTPERAYFDEMRRVSEHQIIWGGNYFTRFLPASRCWLVWYKKDGLPRNSFADCELAWTSFNKNALVFNSRWAGFVKDSREPRVAHPTQKALEVMKWCVVEFSSPGDTILDPFLGSGTTAVAAKLLCRNFVGVEIDREYVAIAKDRIKRAA
jgi:site-specific DNA-methyltransferase (adenine-specific)